MRLPAQATATIRPPLPSSPLLALRRTLNVKRQRSPAAAPSPPAACRAAAGGVVAASMCALFEAGRGGGAAADGAGFAFLDYGADHEAFGGWACEGCGGVDAVVAAEAGRGW